jgi:hypothetical protein
VVWKDDGWLVKITCNVLRFEIIIKVIKEFQRGTELFATDKTVNLVLSIIMLMKSFCNMRKHYDVKRLVATMYFWTQLKILVFCSKLRCSEPYSRFWTACFVLFVLGFTSYRHSIGHIATFQLDWWRKTSGALPCIISGTNGHLSRTTDVP